MAQPKRREQQPLIAAATRLQCFFLRSKNKKSYRVDGRGCLRHGPPQQGGAQHARDRWLILRGTHGLHPTERDLSVVGRAAETPLLRPRGLTRSTSRTRPGHRAVPPMVLSIYNPSELKLTKTEVLESTRKSRERSDGSAGERISGLPILRPSRDGNSRDDGPSDDQVKVDVQHYRVSKCCASD
ncbi:hypothetical protein BHM03_00039040 [Ensete ventricosum]|nr:hypothetical protein BHM03_00039040 [Ensete ventricosum]